MLIHAPSQNQKAEDKVKKITLKIKEEEEEIE